MNKKKELDMNKRKFRPKTLKLNISTVTVIKNTFLSSVFSSFSSFYNEERRNICLHEAMWLLIF